MLWTLRLPSTRMRWILESLVLEVFSAGMAHLIFCRIL